MCSLTESKVKSLINEQLDALVRYADAHLIKSYPGGLRTDSSNMDPVPHWMAGIQCGAIS